MKTLLNTGIFFLFFGGYVEGQNVTTPAGLENGYWIDTLENSGTYGKVFDKGTYVIIPVNTYPIIRKSNSNSFFEVKYINSSAIIFYSKIVNDSFAVKDGTWNRFDSLGNLIGAISWEKGIILSSRDHDLHGNPVYFDTSDYISNCYTSYQYIDNRLFKKKQNSLTENISINYYYPLDKLAISNAEPNFESDFLRRPIDTFKIILFAKDSIAIIGIKDSSHNFKFLDKKKNPISYPFAISKGSKVEVYALFKPSPSSLRSSETFTLVTNELDNKEYPIYATTLGYHLNYKTVEKVSNFSLSISKDKYLIIPRMGTVTVTSVTFPSGAVKYYHISELTKISLSEFVPGKYYISTSSCNAAGSQTMILRK